MVWDDIWGETRLAVFRRDDGTCRRGGCDFGQSDASLDQLHAHHIRAQSRDGPDEAANRITLCETCHIRKHNGATVYYDAEFVQTVHGYGPMTTSEVADWIGCSTTTARRRLDGLADERKIARGERYGTTVWHPPRSLLSRALHTLLP